MSLAPLRQWIAAPWSNYRLFRNFARQDFFGQFTATVGGFLWLFLSPVAHILIFTFVFSYIFRIRAVADFEETRFVVFMMTGYLPWFAFAEAIGRSPGLLLDKAPLITRVMFPVQIIPVVGTVVPWLTHTIGFVLLLVYLAASGYLNWLWLWLPLVYLLQLLFTMGLVAILSALCVFLRDLQQIVALLVTVWFFLTPVIYPLSMIESETVRSLFLLNPMHNFVHFYRELVLLGEFALVNFLILAPVSLLSYALGGWLFMRIRHTFGDVL